MHVSPSQINAFMRCNRLWAFQSLDRFATPPKPGAERGTAIHKEAEEYALYGRPVTDEALLKGAHLLPMGPGTCERWQVEAEFTLTSYGGYNTPLPIKGVIDLVFDDAKPPVLWYVPKRETVAIFDHKSLSDVAKYAKTSKQLTTDPQAIIYAAACFDTFKTAEHVAFTHLYYPTRSGAAKAVSVVFDREQLHGLFWSLMGVVEQMRLSANLSRKQIQTNEANCGDYGGCHFRLHCALAG